MDRIASDGKLSFVRKYDIEASAQRQQFWAGLVTLTWTRRAAPAPRALARNRDRFNEMVWRCSRFAVNIPLGEGFVRQHRKLT